MILPMTPLIKEDIRDILLIDVSVLEFSVF